MASTGGRGLRTQSTEKNRSQIAVDEELKRTLERDTAVQGEGEEESASETRRPAGADDAAPTARPKPRSDRSK